MKDFTDIPIVAPVDFSYEADRAVEAAVELSGNTSNVTIIHVTPPIVIVEPIMAYDIISDEARCEQLKKSLQERYAAPKYQGVHFEVRLGDPGLEIVKLATELKAGLIVMSSHGRTGLKHLLLGSVAERVVRTAKCPVLVMRN
jgi:nucleotide-binding universal stress UspA family protein